MCVNDRFVWRKFYQEFANKLIPYKNDRKELIKKLLNAYKKIGAKFPQLAEDNTVKDIDPFTIFGMFNKGISDANRKVLIESLAEEFAVSGFNIPTTFYGIPVLDNRKANFFKIGCSPDYIDNLWELYAEALNYADKNKKNKDAFIESYNKVIKQPRVKWNITMGLYWIRPYEFVSLDGKNRKLIKSKPELVQKKIFFIG